MYECDQVPGDIQCNNFIVSSPVRYNSGYFVRADVAVYCSAGASDYYQLRATNLTADDLSHPPVRSNIELVPCIV